MNKQNVGFFQNHRKWQTGVFGVGGGGLNPEKQLPKHRHFDFFPWKKKAPKSKTIWNLEFGVFCRTVTWPYTCFKLFLSSFHFNSLILFWDRVPMKNNVKQVVGVILIYSCFKHYLT